MTPSDTNADPVELTITDVAYPGKALGRTADGCVVFVHGAMLNERVRARIVARHKNYVDARLVEVLEPSPARRTPTCPLALRPEADPACPPLYCPGCRYQHMTYEEELASKHRQFASLLSRIGGVASVVLEPPVPAPSPLGYRSKLSLHAAVGDGPARLGYFCEDNTSVVDVPACPLAVAPINELLASLRSNPDFLPKLSAGQAVSFRWTEADGTIFWTSNPDPSHAQHVQWMTESTPWGPLRVPADAFFQVNRPVGDALVSLVTGLVAQTGVEMLIDVYCGAGVFALVAARQGVSRVVGIDTDKHAIRAATRNAREWSVPDATFVAGKAAAMLREHLASADPARTAIMVDPPRRGIEKPLVQVLDEFRPAHLFYVSCAPDTLARDVALLRMAGYTPRASHLLDMFPRTPHFESVIHLATE